MLMGLVAAAVATAAWQIDGTLPALQGDVKLDSSDYELPASLAGEPEPDARIAYVDGMPKVILNGKALEPTFNQSDIDPLPRVNAAIKAESLGLVINQLAIRLASLEQAPGVYDFAQVDERIRRLLRFCPDGRVILNLRLEIPQWLEAHPEAAIAYATGPVDKTLRDDRIGRPFRPSAASREYREEIYRFLKLFADYVKTQPWSKRLIAIRPCWGIYTEWHTYGFYEGPDIGPAMTAAFRAYKGGKYANENPPAWNERLAKPGEYALDPVKDAKVIDYYRCQQEVVSDYLLEVAHRLKALLPGRLVGVYYGYIFTTHPAEGSNVMLDKVLASPDVDFMSDPAAYSPASRLAGGSYYHRTVPATFHRYGKLSVMEDDMRHYVIRDEVSHKKICTRSPREAAETTKRNWINMYFDGCGIQILDPESGDRSKRPFSFDMPEVWRAMHDSQRVLKEMGGRSAESGNQTAAVIDWRERLKRPWKDDPKGGDIYVHSIEGLYASGVPVDLMTLDDFLASPKGRYRRAVLMNLFNPEPEMKAALDRKLADEGIRSVAFLRTPDVPVATTGTAWRELLTGLGEKPLAPEGHYVRRHGDLVLFHTGKTGRWEIEVPGYAGATELFSGRNYYSGRFTVETDGPATLVFRMRRALDFRIGAYSFKPKYRSEAAFRDMKDAGIDYVIESGFHTDFESLDALHRLGLGVFSDGVLPAEWGGHTNVNGKLETLLPIANYERAATRLKRHPAEWMFAAGDENSALDFPYLGRAFRRVWEIRPGFPIYLNLHPSTQVRPKLYFGVENYRRYIEEYCRHVPLDYISYDLYPYCRPRDWGIARLYESYRIVADACRDTQRSFWFVPQVNTTKASIDITAQKLRYQANSALAFGAENLTWACWTLGWWTNNVIGVNGEKTKQYDRLKAVNAELRRLAPEYMRYRRVETGFTGFTGPAAKWIEADPRGNVALPQVNFDRPEGISFDGFADVKAEDGLPLVVGGMVPRDPGLSGRAILVFAADDPYDEKPLDRTVRFRADGKVRALGGNGEVKLDRAADGTWTFGIRSSDCVLVIRQ